jgi:hypothetical protein
MWCGAKRVNQEDVFARWIGRTLRDVVPEGQPIHSTERMSNPQGDVLHQHRKPLGMPSGPRKPVVCIECNGGWMSRIENAVKPSMGPMMLGRIPEAGVLLSSDDMNAIATWATKTALVIDFASFGYTVAGQPVRDEFYRTKQPLPTSRVWLASFVPEWGDLSFWYKTPLGLTDGGLPGSEQMVLVTIGVGYFVAQVLLDVRLDSGGPPNRRPDLTDLFFEVWPRQMGTTWPPAKAMGREWIVHFARTGVPVE